jgi:signal transduction histidine kinase
VPGSSGLILLAPIYRRGAADTPSARLAALRGFSGAFYEIKNLALNALAGLPAGSTLQIFDGAHRLYGPAGTLTDAKRDTIDVGGRRWEIRLQVDSSASLAIPATVLVAGAVLAALVALFFSQANRRQRELELAERELRRQASITAAVLDATPDGIRLIDPGGDVLLTNPALDRLLGSVGWGSQVRTLFDEAERFAETTSDPERFKAALRAVRSDPLLIVEDEYEIAGAGRSFIRYSAPVLGGPDAEVQGRIFVHREVTTERRAERAKDEFIALASHELRTPLTSICGYLEIVEDGDLGYLTAEQLRVLSVIHRNAQRLLRLVDDLLVVARADVGQLGLALEVVDIAEIARECVQGAGPAAEERAIRIGERVEEGPIAVRGDRARLAQVLDNLISNALKFTPSGGRVQVSVRRTGDQAVLEVADNGIGIPLEEQTRLFERFYRTSQVIAAATPGTGLGLAISKMIVEAHGGRIEVDSEQNAGATFRVSLPLARQTEFASATVDRLIPA